MYRLKFNYKRFGEICKAGKMRIQAVGRVRDLTLPVEKNRITRYEDLGGKNRYGT